jgi:tetratricopeptide (TPR) repeat protein
MTYAKLRQPAKAIADISQAIIVDPNVARFRYDRGVLYDAQGEPAKAFTDFSRAIELDADFALAWYNRGVVNNKLNRPDKAIDDYSQAIKLDSNHAPSWNNRGLAYSKLNLPDKAIADLTQAIKLDRKHVSAWAGRGFVYNDLGQLDNAVADFSQAIEFGGPNYPQMASLYRLRAQANSRLGNFEKARADFQEALKIEPKYAWTNHALAWLLATCPDAKLRDAAKAVELASEATRQASKVPDCWRTLGVAHCRAGDWKAAIAALSESRKLSRGGNAADLFFLAMAHWKLGNHKEARNAHDDALQWLETNKKALEKDKYQAEEFRRFRLEAEEVLELRKK